MSSLPSSPPPPLSTSNPGEQIARTQCPFPFYNVPMCDEAYANHPSIETTYTVLRFVLRFWFVIMLLSAFCRFFICNGQDHEDTDSNNKKKKMKMKVEFSHWYEYGAQCALLVGTLLTLPIIIDPLGWADDIVSVLTLRITQDLLFTLLFSINLYQYTLWYSIYQRVNACQHDPKYLSRPSAPLPAGPPPRLSSKRQLPSSLHQEKSASSVPASKNTRQLLSLWHKILHDHHSLLFGLVAVGSLGCLLSFLSLLSTQQGPSWLYDLFHTFVMVSYGTGLLLFGWRASLRLRKLHLLSRPPKRSKSTRKQTKLYWEKHAERERYVPAMLRAMVVMTLGFCLLVIFEVYNAVAWSLRSTDYQSNPPRPTLSAFPAQSAASLAYCAGLTYLHFFYRVGR